MSSMTGGMQVHQPCNLPPSWGWFPVVENEFTRNVAAPKEGSWPQRGGLANMLGMRETREVNGEHLAAFLEPEDACRLLRKPDGERSKYWFDHHEQYVFNPVNCQLPEGMNWSDDTGKRISIPEADGVDSPHTEIIDSLRIADISGRLDSASIENVCPFWRDVCGSPNPPDLPSELKDCVVPKKHRWLKIINEKDPQDNKWIMAPQGGPLCRAYSPSDAYARVKILEQGFQSADDPLYYTCERNVVTNAPQIRAVLAVRSGGRRRRDAAYYTDFDATNDYIGFDPNSQYQQFDPNNYYTGLGPNNDYTGFDPRTYNGAVQAGYYAGGLQPDNFAAAGVGPAAQGSTAPDGSSVPGAAPAFYAVAIPPGSYLFTPSRPGSHLGTRPKEGPPLEGYGTPDDGANSFFEPIAPGSYLQIPPDPNRKLVGFIATPRR